MYHHGCDVDRCPKCFRQSISCDCRRAGEEHLDNYWIEENLALTAIGRGLCTGHVRPTG